MTGIDPKQLKNYKPKIPDSAEIKHARESLSDFFALLKSDPKRIQGFPTRYWSLVNKAFGGVRSELVVITAETGNGKSTFARNWIQDCFHQQLPSLLISLEEGIMSSMFRFSQMEIGKSPLNFSDLEKKAWAQSLEQYPFYYVDWKGPIKEALLLNSIHYAIDTHGIKFIVLDHLDYVEKSWRDNRNESYVIGDFLRTLAGIAHSKECMILLVAHPSKLNVQGDRRREVGIDDLKGSSSVKQEADAVFSLYRETDNSYTYLKFLKIRSSIHSKFLNTKIKLRFDNSNLRFEEVDFDGQVQS